MKLVRSPAVRKTEKMDNAYKLYQCQRVTYQYGNHRIRIKRRIFLASFTV